MSSLNSQNQIQSTQSSPFTSLTPNSNQVLNKPVAISKLFKPLNLIQESNSISSSSTTTQKANILSEEQIQFPIIVPSIRLGIDETFNKLNNKNIKNMSENSSRKNFNFKEKNCCTCTKTKCIKKYCECFAIGKYCFGCHCVNCLNKPIFNKNENEETNQNLNNENNNQNINYKNNNNINNINNSNEENLNQNDISFISCTCSKSFCNKKYCECFKAGKKCSEKCRCLHCLNGNNNNNNDINESYLNEDNYCNKSNSENNLMEVKPEDYTMQTTSVFISKSKTIIEVEKKDKEDMKKLISLKRNRDNS